MKNLSLSLALGLLTSSAATGAPILHPTWPSVKLVNNFGAELLRDSADERLIWVKPPSIGSVLSRNSAISEHPNHSRCEELATSLKDVLGGIDEFDKGLEEIYGLQNDLIRYQRKLSSALQDEAKTVESSANINMAKTIASTTRRLIELELEYLDVVHRVDSCRGECKPLYQRKLELENEKKSILQRIADYEDTHKYLTDTLYQQAQTVLSARKNIYNIDYSISNIAQHLSTVERRLFQGFSKKSILPAGHQTITYRTNWKEVVSALARANPKFVFKPVPIRSLRLRSRLVPEKIDDFYLATLPIFLRFDSPNLDLAHYGRIEHKGSFITTPISEIKARYYYSLGGVCPLINESYFSLIKEKIHTDESQVPRFGAILTYSYLVQTISPVSVRYHPYLLYKKLRSLNSDENYIGRNEFIKWVDEGHFADAILLPNAFSAKQSLGIVSELVSRVLAAMSNPQVFPLPNKRSASSRQNQLCKDYYCKINGWDLISGENMARGEETLLKNHNKWQDVSVNNDNSMTITDITIFEPR